MSETTWLSEWDELAFDNRFTHELPADPETANQTRQVHNACYSRVTPKRVAAPELIAHSPELASQLGIPDALIRSDQFAQVFGGNLVHPAMDPFAMCYGGHQFGNWAGQLGDGRAINLTECIDRNGVHQTLQLKGAGPTPYSRFADGLAVLRSSVREFLCSEAMHHLGVPTTRALSLVLTGDWVTRDMFYDGNPQQEPGAIVCRVAPSFVRLGNFQLFASREEEQTLRQLADFTIRNDFSHLGEPSPEVYAEWFAEICQRTAELMVHWMRVGFVHGVMNTDNLSVLGLTIDYGPYGWLEDYDPNWTPNTTDAQGRRYRYGNQPQIAQWNLAQFGGALLPLVDQRVESLQTGLSHYVQTFEEGWNAMMAAKLGLDRFRGEDDLALFGDLLQVLQLAETDMTLFYRELAKVPCESEVDAVCDSLSDAYYKPEEVTDEVREQTQNWFDRYRARVRSADISDANRRERMDRINPLYVLRNYLAQLAIDRSEQGDHAGITELLDVLRDPYREQPGCERFAEKRPEWARHRAGCSMLSCSS
ncbi:YdiU family protein [Roseiconus nitratireducens]|uniref:Protein nucleotidyltransferase YdiU n=1 Tax=Roseiconus nitratireducens TaxID=2605748 RepID=A0A5M6D2Y4_9BACT|nr:YdiU family protein [Roseiconus nitratireducens]KAA5541877.1 YdiU family protein [Roseiconus nitratireducens]